MKPDLYHQGITAHSLKDLTLVKTKIINFTNFEMFQVTAGRVSEILQSVVLLVRGAVEGLAGQDHLVTELEPHQLLVLPPVPQLQPNLRKSSK